MNLKSNIIKLNFCLGNTVRILHVSTSISLADNIDGDEIKIYAANRARRFLTRQSAPNAILRKWYNLGGLFKGIVGEIIID